jgi:hypothetical protein
MTWFTFTDVSWAEHQMHVWHCSLCLISHFTKLTLRMGQANWTFFAKHRLPAACCESQKQNDVSRRSTAWTIQVGTLDIFFKLQDAVPQKTCLGKSMFIKFLLALWCGFTFCGFGRIFFFALCMLSWQSQKSNKIFEAWLWFILAVTVWQFLLRCS